MKRTFVPGDLVVANDEVDVFLIVSVRGGRHGSDYFEVELLMPKSCNLEKTFIYFDSKQSSWRKIR